LEGYVELDHPVKQQSKIELSIRPAKSGKTDLPDSQVNKVRVSGDEQSARIAV
jgi:hypothetical protein